MTKDIPKPPIGCLGCLGRGLILVFAAIGFLQTSYRLFGPIITDTLLRPMYVTEVTMRVPSPNQLVTANIEVTRGGFGTVWTTRVLLLPKGEEGWVIYSTKDSDYTPTLRWLDNETLLLGIGCERFGHISNDDDWERSNKAGRRLKVRIFYADKRCAPQT